jgi:hypothetical protein
VISESSAMSRGEMRPDPFLHAVSEHLTDRLTAALDGGGLVASGVGYQRATLQPGMGRLTDDRTPDATSACRR